MWRSILPWFASLLVVVVCWLPAGHAQQNPLFPSGGGASATPQPESSTVERPMALAWGVAILFTLIILVIVCMPSRKTQT
jgi:hypothetical protein